MPLDLTKQAIGPEDPNADLPPDLDTPLSDIQGNILKSHGRDHSQHLFITFTDAGKAKKWVTSMAGRVTSASKQWKDSLKRHKIFEEAEMHGYPAAWRDEQLAKQPSSVFINLLLSHKGYVKLDVPKERIPQDAAFTRGAQHPKTIEKLADPPLKAPSGGDPEHQWEEDFRKDLHALVIVADDSPAKVAQTAKEISDEVGKNGGTIAHTETGLVLRYGENGPVREHFGFVDGVSNPLFYAKDVAKVKPANGKFRYDPRAPLGLVLVKDPGGKDETYGSYFVYRKLEQKVAQFKQDRFTLATALAQKDSREAANEADKELAGAYMVGRFRDGAPVVAFASESGVGRDIPNDFDYSADANGDKCPFQAHTRKTNPRNETGDAETERSHRIVRRAISFEKGDKVGLLFLCAQSSIEHQFEFMQASWCDNTGFLRPDTGLDPIVGQGSPTEQEWPKKHGKSERIKVTLKQSVVMRGGEYFFMPSLSFLKSLGV